MIPTFNSAVGYRYSFRNDQTNICCTVCFVPHHSRCKEPLPIIQIAERCVAGGSVTSQESGTRPGTPKAGENHAYHLYTSLPGWWKWVAERRSTYRVEGCLVWLGLSHSGLICLAG
ncbi:hypothetical protein Pmani_030626 [Petrolisthes manimaculis]|uniref:Uncharacterized protein n=1 Tax=Petrolisthes manimaculis TaxID=1843537 RepID=A0AAE1NXG6_9EUCA|nr:hypothetical protein Pmani_030626 [Petrolisthes manimaculis]